MNRTATSMRRSYTALTVNRKGRLSKNHIADPNVGLSDELRREQAEAVVVNLRPLRPVQLT